MGRRSHRTGGAVRRDREWRLFLDLCAPLARGIVSLPTPPEWPRMLEILGLTRFEALAFHNLKARGLEDQVPAPVLEQLRAGHAWSLARYHLLGEMVAPYLGALSRDVDFLVLKGTAWAHTVYPEPHLRQSGDIDLLVKEADQEAAGRVLEERGFDGSWGRWRDHGPSWSRQVPGGSAICIELHPDLSQPTRYPRLRGAAPTDRALQHPLWGQELRLCSPELGFLQCILQLAWRLRTGGYARYLVDTLQITTNPAFDAAWTYSVASASGLLGLRYCATSLLAPSVRQTPPHHSAAIGTWALTHGLSCPWVRSTPPRRGIAALASLALWDRWDDRGRHVWVHAKALPRLMAPVLGGSPTLRGHR